MGVNLGFLKAIAFSQIYAKSYARGSAGFHEALLRASFTAKAMPALAKGFKIQRILLILRHEQNLKHCFEFV